MLHKSLIKKYEKWFSSYLTTSMIQRYNEFLQRYDQETRNDFEKLYMNEVDDLILKVSRINDLHASLEIFENAPDLLQCLFYERIKSILNCYVMLDKEKEYWDHKHPDALIVSSLLLEWYWLRFSKNTLKLQTSE